MQSVREIRAIIVTDNYLCYRYQKVLATFFFLILIFNELLRLKLRMNDNIERLGALLWTGRKPKCCLCSHTDRFAFSTVLPRLSDQKIIM